MTDLTAPLTNQMATRAFRSEGSRDNERAFRVAKRHSRQVRFMRVAVPVGVVLGLTGLLLATYFNPLRLLSGIPIDIGKLVVSGSKITMDSPKLAGFTRDKRAYEMTASAASQDITQPNVLELKNLRGKVEMQDKGVMNLSSAKGLYDSKKETLTLQQDILLTSSTGYEARLSEAVVDIRSGAVNSQSPVKVKLLQGTLDANRLEVQESGDLVRFGGGVTMELHLNQSNKANQAAAQ